MKIKLEGKIYDLSAALAAPTLIMLREMKIRTGYGMKSLMDAAAKFEGKDEMEILEDSDLIGAFIAMIWLARRSAGENITFEQAGSFDMGSLEYIADEDPEQDPAAGPKALTDSAPAGDAPAAPAPVSLT